MKSIREIAAARILRSRCSVDMLRTYLVRKQFDTEEIDETIGEFLEYGYLDDLQYAVDFIRYGENKGWGKRRICNELRRKGVNLVYIERAYDEKYESDLEDENLEEERALEVARKMLCQSGMEIETSLPEKLRNRIIRRLLSYGYNSSVVFSVLRRLDELVREGAENCD